MYNLHLPIMLESERQAVYRERKRKITIVQSTAYNGVERNWCIIALTMKIRLNWGYFLMGTSRFDQLLCVDEDVLTNS